VQVQFSTQPDVPVKIASKRKLSFEKKLHYSVVWYKKKKEGKTTLSTQALSESERKTVLQLASFIPG